MEKLMKDKSRASSEAPSSSDTASGSSTAPPSTSDNDYRSTSTDYARLPDHVDMNSSATLAASMLLDNSHVSGDSQQMLGPPTAMTPHASARVSSQNHQLLIRPHATTEHRTDTKQQVVAPVSDYRSDTSSQMLGAHSRQPPSSNDGSYLQTSKLRYIPPITSNRPTTSNQYASAPPGGQALHQLHSDSSNLPFDISDIELADSQDSLSLRVQSLTNRPGTSTPTRNSPRVSKSPSPPSAGTKMSAIELENAALKAELDIINSDRNSLHKVRLESRFLAC